MMRSSQFSVIKDLVQHYNKKQRINLYEKVLGRNYTLNKYVHLSTNFYVII